MKVINIWLVGEWWHARIDGKELATAYGAGMTGVEVTNRLKSLNPGYEVIQGKPGAGGIRVVGCVMEKLPEKTVFKRGIDALVACLKELEERNGSEGYRQDYDKAVHLWVALQKEGLKVIRDSKTAPNPPSGKTLVGSIKLRPHWPAKG